jgi:hypothetical protein
MPPAGLRKNNPMPKFLALLILAIVGTMSQRVEPDSQVTVDFGIAGGTLSTYGDSTWVNVRLRPDLPIESDAEAGEWSLEFLSGPDCTGDLVAVSVATDPPAYGPRFLERLGVTDFASVQLVHKGDHFEGHADHPGRHPIACRSTP